MEKQFADYETSRMLKELGFNEECFGYWTAGGSSVHIKENSYINFERHSNSELHVPASPLWQQVEEWLFDKHKIRIDILSHGDVPNCDFICSVLLNESVLVQSVFEHPIKARMDGIRQSVEYLHKQLNK